MAPISFSIAIPLPLSLPLSSSLTPVVGSSTARIPTAFKTLIRRHWLRLLLRRLVFPIRLRARRITPLVEIVVRGLGSLLLMWNVRRVVLRWQWPPDGGQPPLKIRRWEVWSLLGHAGVRWSQWELLLLGVVLAPKILTLWTPADVKTVLRVVVGYWSLSMGALVMVLGNFMWRVVLWR